VLIKFISSLYIAGLQTLLFGSKNASSKVVGTLESDVMAEYTSLGVSLIVLIDSASVGVMPNLSVLVLT
jgi:hypothetical protein